MHSGTNSAAVHCPPRMMLGTVHCLHNKTLKKQDGKVLQTWHRTYQWKAE